MDKQTCNKKFKRLDYRFVVDSLGSCIKCDLKTGSGPCPVKGMTGPKDRAFNCNDGIFKKKKSSQAEFIIEKFVDEDLNKMVRLKDWKNVLGWNKLPEKYKGSDSFPFFGISDDTGCLLVNKDGTVKNRTILKVGSVCTEEEWNEILETIKLACEKLASINKELRQKNKRAELEKEWCGEETIKI